jgi:hypothetical protein
LTSYSRQPHTTLLHGVTKVKLKDGTHEVEGHYELGVVGIGGLVNHPESVWFTHVKVRDNANMGRLTLHGITSPCTLVSTLSVR